MVNQWPLTWYPVNRLRSELDRVVNDVLGDAYGERSRWPGRMVRERSFPAVNLWEDEGNVYAEAELPGLKMEDLELLVRGDELTIKGERRHEEQEGVTYHRRERGTGTFCGVVRLPVQVDVDKVEASLEAGVLTVTLPKAASARPRKIEVKALKS